MCSVELSSITDVVAIDDYSSTIQHAIVHTPHGPRKLTIDTSEWNDEFPTALNSMLKSFCRKMFASKITKAVRDSGIVSCPEHGALLDVPRIWTEYKTVRGPMYLAQQHIQGMRVLERAHVPISRIKEFEEEPHCEYFLSFVHSGFRL